MYTYLTIAVLVLIILYLVYRFSYREDKNRRFITDDQGRILIFHGMNVISAAKSDPLRVGGTTKEDFHRLSNQWGFNAVRLLVFWDGIEPQKGQYEPAYLARLRQRLDWCTQAGLAVILDMHQDLYAIQFGGDGAPDWAVWDDEQPFEYQTPWELNYLQPAVKAAIDNFWMKDKGHPELQDHYVNAVLKVVEALAEHPAVIGIDLYNEPTMASLHGLLNLERRYLTALQQRIINAIREINNDLWIFFEPSALGPNQGFGSRLGKLKDPRTGESRLAYFPHLYTLDLDISGKYLGWPLFINFWAHMRRRETRKFKTPLMVGEFGLGEDKPGALKFLNDVLAMYDKITSGWFYWSYDRGSWGVLDSDGQELRKAAVLERPYPQKIAGTKPSFRWEPGQRTFSLSFDCSRQLEPPTRLDESPATQVYLPARAWPEGWNLVNLGVEIAQSYDPTRRILSIHAKEAGEVRVRIESRN